MIVDPCTPLYNTIVFYILILALLLLIKPEFMYSNKLKLFKQFGSGEDQTLFAFPLICIGSSITLYTVFILINLFCEKIK